MIHHTVFFRLKHPAGSAAETDFLDAALGLTRIPGVENFRRLRQISPKAPYDFGLSMVFENQAAHDAYSAHPIHQEFVEQRWLKEVESFQEIDYEELAASE